MLERERTAQHEAAHAVAAYRFQLDFCGADIIQEAENAGQTYGNGKWNDTKEAEATLVLLAPCQRAQ
jgi:hypothetical protein